MDSLLAIFHGPGQAIELRRVPLPPLGPGEVLVRNTCTTLCRSDVTTFTGKRTEKTPTILGHEITGVIAELGPEAPTQDLRGAPLRPGDRVTWAIYASDPDSVLARAGMPQKAPGLFKYGHERLDEHSSFHGGLAEHTILRRHTPIVRLPGDMPDVVAALANCSVATVAGALRLAGDISGRLVLVSGAGMLGTIACAMAKAAGAASVVALDTDVRRAAAATAFGADLGLCVTSAPVDNAAVEAQLHRPLRAAAVLEFSGAPAAMAATLELLDIGGTAVWVGATYPQSTTPINAERLVRGLWTIRGLHNYNATDLLTAVLFLEQHHRSYPFRELVDDRFTLAEANAAFAHAVAENPFRVGLHLGAPARLPQGPEVH